MTTVWRHTACKGSTGLLTFAVLTWGALLGIAVQAEEPAASSAQRYAHISQLVRRNMHMGAHFQKAVTLKTVLRVRSEVTEGDIPTLALMLGDPDTNVLGSVAGDLLVMLGSSGQAALEAAALSTDGNTRLNAQQALRGLADCAHHRRRPELCPK